MKHLTLALGVLALMVCGCSAQYSEKELEKACINGTLNVFMFGAKGDGVTDDTQAIQRGIDFLDARGGGRLFFPFTPKGYLLASPAREYADNGRLVRAQLVLPPGGSNILLEGEMPCIHLHAYQVRLPDSVKDHFSPTTFGMGNSNTLLHSTWDAPEVTDPEERPWSVIAAPEGDSCNGRFSRTILSMENLEVRVHLDTAKMYPTTSAAFLKNVSRVNIRNCQFCLDENVGDTYLGKYLLENPCHTVGLHTSGDQNDNQVLSNVAVQGFRYGLVLGEHVVADYLYVHNCEEGIVFHDATHLSVINHVVAQHNRVIFSTTVTNLFGHPRSRCNVIVGSVNFESGRRLLPEVSGLVYGIYDPENRFHGSLVWHQPWGDGEFPIEGAKNLKVSRFPVP